jgi:hypothetical protein
MQRKFANHRHLKFEVQTPILFFANRALDVPMLGLASPANLSDLLEYLDRVTNKASRSVPCLRGVDVCTRLWAVTQASIKDVLSRSSTGARHMSQAE